MRFLLHINSVEEALNLTWLPPEKRVGQSDRLGDVFFGFVWGIA